VSLPAELFPAARWPGLTLADEPWGALHGADGLLILTEWDSFRTAPLEIRRHLSGRLVVDGRNLLDPDQCASVGLQYAGIGRRIKG
jgi:UDPglucose 6-dehydrogenase